ncbi:hypothetical protein F5888DRAFT_1831762 [Russula emetica]|nr:hypothetical protein F5888DRAFT_1831762 [Russula emetica]
MPTATNGQTSPVPPSLRVLEESHSSSTPAPQRDSATPSAEATPAGVTAASPMPIKPTQPHTAISIPNGDQLLRFDPVLTGCNVKKPAWLSELHTHTTLDPPLPPQNHPLYRRTACSHKPPPTFWKFIRDRPLPITPQFARLLLARHCRSPNSDSATYRRSDRSSPHPESDDGMLYNHRCTSVKADEMAPEDTQLTSRAPNSDGMPRQPMNAFMIFAHRRRPQVSAANQTMRTGDISKILSKEWNSMDMVNDLTIVYRPPSYSADDDDGESPEALPELTPRIPSGRPSQLIALSRNSPAMPLHLAHLLPVVLVQHRHQVARDQQRPLALDNSSMKLVFRRLQELS